MRTFELDQCEGPFTLFGVCDPLYLCKSIRFPPRVIWTKTWVRVQSWRHSSLWDSYGSFLDLLPKGSNPSTQ